MGCGQGDFLVEAQKRNWNVYGAEYSAFAIKLCESRGIEMHQGDLTKIFLIKLHLMLLPLLR